MVKHIDEVDLVIFDTETTGLDPVAGDRVVEIAGLRIIGNKRISSFQTLVNPGRAPSEAASKVNGITEDLLKDAPAPKEAIESFLNFAQDAYLCSYNAPFDIEFFDNELKIIGRNKWHRGKVIDILRMARKLLPGLERYALWFVSNYLKISQEQIHRASSDVEITTKVFFKLKEILTNQKVTEFNHFVELFGIDAVFMQDLVNQKCASIQEAIDSGGHLLMKYLSIKGQVTEREVIPKEIRQEGKISYLLAYCCLHQEERLFRVDGMLNFKMQ